MPATRRTKGVVLAPARDNPMPRKTRSRATSVASSQRSDPAPQEPAVISRLAARNEDLASENEELREELEYQQQQKPKRWTLRDKQLADRIAEQTSRRIAEERTQASLISASAVAVTSPPPPPPAALALPPPPTTSPSHARQAAVATPSRDFTVSNPFVDNEPPATVPRWRQMLHTLGAFSPFSARRAPVRSTPQPPQQQSQQPPPESPLGQLPPNRKRSAPPTESSPSSKRAKTPERADAAPPTNAKSTQPAPTPLEPISEHKEPTEGSNVVPPTPATPSRPPKRMAPQSVRPESTGLIPKATPRRRNIRDVRAARDSLSSFPATTNPTRTHRWETPQKPREPNADKRLARMQQLEALRAQKLKMEEEIQKLAAEQEADGIDTRRRKRVKVDELAYIPHNQPGDAEGTFRVPEWDSDDEMEVDDDVPVRQNVFSVNAEQQQEKVLLQPPQHAAPPATLAPPHPRVSPFTPSPLSQKPQTASDPSPDQPRTSLFAQPSLQQTAKQQPLTAQPQPTEKLQQQETQQQQFQQPQSQKPSFDLFSKPTISAPEQQKKASYNWPSVGPRQPDDEWPEARKIAAGEKFARGFNAWVAAGMPA